MGYSSVKLYKDMVKALRPAKTIRTKVTPVSSAPATGWQAADRLTKKALELYLQSQKEEKEKQDRSIARAEMSDVMSAYYDRGGQPAYDAVANASMDMDETSDDVDRDAGIAFNRSGGIDAVNALAPPVSSEGQDMQIALMADAHSQRQARKAAELKRSQGMEDFRTKAGITAQYREPKPRRIVTTAEGVYMQNPDDSLGERLGSPPNQFGYTARPNVQAPLEKGEKPSILKAPRTPWDSVPPRDRGRMQISVRKAATSLLNSESKALQESNLVANRLKRFKYLNSIEETGGLMDRVTDVSVDEQKREMVSIVDNLTPLMRQGLPGAASERDTAMFRGATVGINKTRAINNNIVAGHAALNQMGKDRLAFRQEYLQVNGHLEGSEKMWTSYAEANPIFDFSSPEGSYELNKNRKSYNDFFYKSDNKVRVVDF